MSRCAAWITLDSLDCDASSVSASGMIEVASDWVYTYTGSRWPGVCTTTIRPTLSCGHDGIRCHCHTRWERMDLTRWLRGPIVSLDAVEVGGTAYTPADVARIDNAMWLTPIAEGKALWPWPTQNINKADGESDTWSITVTHGALPPAPVLHVTGELACQLVKRANGADCELPSNATSVSDNGVSINLAIPEGGKTGIPRIDTVLELYGAGRRRSRIWDPRMMPAPRVV